MPYLLNKTVKAMTATVMLTCTSMQFAFAENTPAKAADECFESREKYSVVKKKEIESGLPNVKCSPTTSAVLWWGDPFHDTQPMGHMPIEADYTHGEAVVRSRIEQIDRNKLYAVCSIACHDKQYVPIPLDKLPRALAMHQDIVPDSTKLKHGKGGIWCLDCHHPIERTQLIDNFNKPVSFDQPQKLCGKCHGPIYRDWRDGIHGKRIGMWEKSGKKRWWVCTECHNPHDVEDGERNSGFTQLTPEPAPVLPKGMPNADHERMGHGVMHEGDNH